MSRESHDKTRSLEPARGAGSTWRWSLLVFEGGQARSFTLPERGLVLVGRGDDADLKLADTAASRRHARFLVGGGEVRVADLDSHNGTRVNATRIEGTVTLGPGDVVTIGEAALVLRAIVASDEGRRADEDRVQRIDLGDQEILVADPAMARLYALVGRLAESDLAVLVGGETGVGKENVARALHRLSPRRDRPFVSLNCAAMPETLVESELFGYEKGAFSGATAAKLGLLESASGGTLLLDELGELALPVQAKLLRALETRRVTRLGSVKECAIDLRLVAATHRDLEADAAAGRFRSDLFFRLSAATVTVPPLRDRPREIPLLARFFLDGARRSVARGPLTLGDDALAALGRHAWPGNVRELKNVMELLSATLPAGVVHVEDLPDRVRSTAVPPAPSPAGETLRATLDQAEREGIVAALARCHGNQTRAADLLGISRRTLITKIEQYGLPRPRKRD